MARTKAESTIKTAPRMSKAPALAVKPLSGYVLIRPQEAMTKTASGIYLPENAQEKKAVGEVLAVGEALSLPGGQYITAPVKVGDKVYYKKWGGDEIDVAGEELKLVKFEDLIAILEG